MSEVVEPARDGEGDLCARVARIDLALHPDRTGAHHEDDDEQQAEEGEAPPPSAAASRSTRERDVLVAVVAVIVVAVPTVVRPRSGRRRLGSRLPWCGGTRRRRTGRRGRGPLRLEAEDLEGIGLVGVVGHVGFAREVGGVRAAVGGRIVGRPAVEPGLQEHCGCGLVDHLASGLGPCGPPGGGAGRRSPWSGAHRRFPRAAGWRVGARRPRRGRPRRPGRSMPSSDRGRPTTMHSTSASAASSSRRRWSRATSPLRSTVS